ncbi:hypothetical protein LOZ66_005193 [Ophidiomyces ophidiicola]|nr:hypothetical protein LOZ65_001683 [Ophidiomyces ophidiicola]KAI1935653.1 hypothetical protein LOZ66_005193 [Ophidiomyces ophidiicola]
MRSAILSILSLLSTPLLTYASPFPTPPPSNDNILIPRNCPNPCGFYKQVCCDANQQCYTDANNQAACRAGGGDNGSWEPFTTTFTRTDLVVVTSTGSRYVAATAPGNSQCKTNLGETPCGSICCTAAQMCNGKGVCIQAGGSPWETIPGPSASPPVRPTSGSTITATVPVTTTVGFIPAVSTDGTTLIGPAPGGGGGGSHLSGGAIAGIVIGSLAGAFILLLLCLCCCVGGAANRLRGLCCGGRRRRNSYSESSMSQSVSGAQGRPHSHPRPPPQSSGLSKWAPVLGIIGAIALCLGLRRRRDESEKSTAYNTTYYTSSSSSSSHLGHNWVEPENRPPPGHGPASGYFPGRHASVRDARGDE